MRKISALALQWCENAIPTFAFNRLDVLIDNCAEGLRYHWKIWKEVAIGGIAGGCIILL